LRSRRSGSPAVTNGVPLVRLLAFPTTYGSLLRSGSFLVRRDAAAARPLLPPIRCTRGGGERENPKRGWVAWRPCHAVPALLNRSRGQLEGEKPPLPLAVRRAGQVALEADAWARLGYSVKGQKGL
jgi:hypothetical protein